MSSTQLYRLSGLALALGGLLSIIANTGTSVLFPENTNPSYVTNPLFVPLNLLGVVGAAMLLLGLPGLYTRQARQGDGTVLLGMVLIFVTGLMFGIFLSLTQVLLFPFLATQAPQVYKGDGPAGFFPFFILGTAAEVVGSILFALPMLRGRVLPRWPGYALIVSALAAVVGFLLQGPSGPPSVLAIVVNLASGDLLFVALGWLGYELWSRDLRVTGELAGARPA